MRTNIDRSNLFLKPNLAHSRSLSLSFYLFLRSKLYSLLIAIFTDIEHLRLDHYKQRTDTTTLHLHDFLFLILI